VSAVSDFPVLLQACLLDTLEAETGLTQKHMTIIYLHPFMLAFLRTNKQVLFFPPVNSS